MKKSSLEGHLMTETVTQKPNINNKKKTKSASQVGRKLAKKETGDIFKPKIAKKKNIEKESKNIKKKMNLSTKKIEKLLREPKSNVETLDGVDQWQIKKQIINIIDKKTKAREERKSQNKKSAKLKENDLNIEAKLQEDINKKTSNNKEFLYYGHLTSFRSSLECEKIAKQCGKIALSHRIKEIDDKKYIKPKKSPPSDKKNEANTCMRGLKTMSQNLKGLLKPPQDFKNILQNQKDDKQIDVVFSRVASAPGRLKNQNSKTESSRAKTAKTIRESASSIKKTPMEPIPENKESKIKEKIEPKVPKQPEKIVMKKSSTTSKKSRDTIINTSDKNLPRKIFPIIEVEPGKFQESSSALAKSSFISQKRSEDSNNSYFSFDSK